MVPVNCATGSLAPYTPTAEHPWDKSRVQHLYRRLGFGATMPEIEAGLALAPSALVDQLIDEAIAAPLPPKPDWADWTVSDYDDFFAQRQEQFIEWTLRWVTDMVEVGPREKLALFWHNHFVTRFEVYNCMSYLYRYHRLLQTYALGNFKEFLIEMGRTPAMLIYLNGVQNVKGDPNENYARELYELFTLGQDNGYTQDDIKATARALTGFVSYREGCGDIDFAPEFFDNSEKTIFGRTGNWNYLDVHDLLFEERGERVARHICGKLYRHFVHPETDAEIVNQLAETFRNNNFELAPVLRQLFKSEHFFDDYTIGVQIKSPIESFMGIVRESGKFYDHDILLLLGFQAYNLDQQLFNPVDVAGWPGNRSWIDSNTLTGRWQTLRGYLFYTFEEDPLRLGDLARQLGGDSTDPAFVTRQIVDYFLPRGLQQEEAYMRATEAFKFEIPQNYFDRNLWHLDWETVPIQTALLLDHIVRLPEFELH